MNYAEPMPITMPSPDSYGYPTFARVASWGELTVGVFAYDERKALVSMTTSPVAGPDFVTRRFQEWSLDDLHRGLDWTFSMMLAEFGEPTDDTGMVGPDELAEMMEPNRATWTRGISATR